MKKFGQGRGNVLQIQLLIAIVKYQTVLKKPRHGLCSRYVAALRAPTRVTATFLRNSTFMPAAVRAITDNTLQSQPDFNPRNDQIKPVPIIVIATGTGIAPVRALLLERDGFRKHPRGILPGECHLFFGGRNRKADFYYEEEMEHMIPITVHPAFSRDQYVIPSPLILSSLQPR